MDRTDIQNMHETSCALIWEMLQPNLDDARRISNRQAIADLIMAHTGEDITKHADKDVDPESLRLLLTPRQSAGISLILQKLQKHRVQYANTTAA